MTCVHCKKEIERYFTLFNGTLVCPLCGEKAFAPKMTFAITTESNNEFLLSEALFLEAIKEKDKKKMEKAVYHCSLAASMLHPMAYFKMGYYYDRDYTAKEKTEAFRTSVAYGYYSSLCYCNSSNSEMVNFEAYNLTDIRKRSAENMLIMLKAFENDRTLYATNKEKCEQLGLVAKTENKNTIKKDVLSAFDETIAILRSFKIKKQAPSLALIKLNAEDFYNVFENPEFWQIYQIMKGKFKLYVSDENNGVSNLSAKGQIKSFLDDNKGVKATYNLAIFDEKISKNTSKTAIGSILDDAFACVNDTKVVLYSDDIAVMKANATPHESFDEQIKSFLRQYATI